MREDVELYVRGRILRSWSSVAVTRSLDTAAAAFRMACPGRSPFPVAPGDLVEVLAGGELILKGHADRVERQLASSGSVVSIEGRDVTADLVDCSPPESPPEWTSIDLEDLLTQVAGPFGVLLDYQAGPKAPLERVRPRPGDTAWSVIERACRLRGVLVYSNGTGRLVVREAGRDLSDVELVEGSNLLAATFTADDSLRFRTYTVRGQRPGSNSAFGDLVTRVQGEATDDGARAGRRLIILAEGLVTNQTSEERAQWEATVRAAAAARLEAVVGDWRKAPTEGALDFWTPNEQVAVRAPSLDMDGYLLAREVTLEQDQESQRAVIDLVRADAFRMQPVLAEEDDPLELWRRLSGELQNDGEFDPLELGGGAP